MGLGWDRCQCYRHSGKEPFCWLGGILEGTGDCPLDRASVLGDGGFRFRRSGTGWPYHFHLLLMNPQSKSRFRTSPRLG